MEIEPIGPNSPRPSVQNPSVSEVASLSPTRRVERGAGQSSDVQSNRNGDSVELSARARELQRARQAVEDAPDVRADRVAEIRQRLAAGTYDVSPEDLARKLLGEG